MCSKRAPHTSEDPWKFYAVLDLTNVHIFLGRGLFTIFWRFAGLKQQDPGFRGGPSRGVKAEVMATPVCAAALPC